MWLTYLLSFLLPAQVAHAGDKEDDERAAKTACLSGDHANGVAILAELYVKTNNPTFIFNQGRVSVASSADGTKLVATVNGGCIYSSSGPAP
jgi:hypothetical protein